MDFEITRDAGIATARLSGLALLEGWEEMLPRLGAQAAGDRRLLIVIEGLVGFLGTPERRKVGELAATHLRHCERVAMLVPTEKKTGVTEKEARRLGLEFRVFDDAQEAAAWLQA